MKIARTPRDPLTRKALKALQEAVAQVVEEHRREGRPLAEWKNGKATLVQPGLPSVVPEAATCYGTRAHRKKR